MQNIKIYSLEFMHSQVRYQLTTEKTKW